MKENRMRYWQGACIMLMAVGMMAVMLPNSSKAAESSCVQCHTDEDMLEDNLSKVKKKGSSMTSGSG